MSEAFYKEKLMVFTQAVMEVLEHNRRLDLAISTSGKVMLEEALAEAMQPKLDTPRCTGRPMCGARLGEPHVGQCEHYGRGLVEVKLVTPSQCVRPPPTPEV